MNQPIEVKELRNRLREAAKVSGFPQMLMRMGYGAEVPPTPRRSVNEVLMNLPAASGGVSNTSMRKSRRKRRGINPEKD